MQNKSLKTFELNVLSKNQLKRITEDETINNDAVYLTPDCSVEYTKQNLTDAQKAQARANIGVPDINITPDSIIGFDGEGNSVNWDISYGDGEDIIPDAIVQRTGQDIKVPDHFEDVSFSYAEECIYQLENISGLAVSGADVAEIAQLIVNDVKSSIDGCYNDIESIASDTVSSNIDNLFGGSSNVLLGTDSNGYNSFIGYSEYSETSKIPVRNDDGTFEIGAANISFTDSGGYPIFASDAYSYANNNGKSNLPVTVNDISAMLQNFDLNLYEMHMAMSYSSNYVGKLGYYGTIPIPVGGSLNGDYSDISFFETNEPYSIPVRNENGQVSVALLPSDKTHAASKYYVDQYQKKISNRDCTVINVESTFDINVWEVPPGEYGEYGLVFYEFYLPVSIPQEYVGKEVTFSIDTTISSVSLTNSYSSNNSSLTPYEMIGLVSSKGESFWNEADNCLAYNDNSTGWELNSYRCVPTSTMMYLAIIEPNAGIPENWKDDFIYKYSTYLTLRMSYRGYLENGTPVHDTYLHSDTEIHLKDPIDSIIIEDLVRCYPENIAQEWTISFKTGSNLPNITVPNNTIIPVRHAYQEEQYDSNYNVIGFIEKFEYIDQQLPIKWLYAEPVFEANKKYLITFKQIIDTIYGVWTVLE